MTTPLIDATDLAAALDRFAEERDWAQFHSPKNLAMALAGETGELVEIFQWMTEAESHEAGRDPRTARAVRDEMADVLCYLVRLADRLGVDLDAAVRDKLAANALKYPVELARGSNRKYDEL
ncbi:nucleotide pyrophosphohydrolase [Derxia gummosa]|uniref:Nucleotide pyrophosphohydrolase n=1 Tax=Derxia gummosa DSM 723 TaxID=1121388 RepID=A0A8B6X3J6_9BURK|nr:nucleotide pyrophosphohydrolase [Derxia gummosa]